jgi:hypothetical protein
MIANFRETGQQISGFNLQRCRQPQQRFDPNLPAILLDQIDLGSMQACFGGKRLLRQDER